MLVKNDMKFALRRQADLTFAKRQSQAGLHRNMKMDSI